MKELFHDLFSQATGMPFCITYPDGTARAYGGDGKARFNLIFRTETAMRAMLVNVDLGFGEAYMVGDIDIEGRDDRPHDHGDDVGPDRRLPR